MSVNFKIGSEKEQNATHRVEPCLRIENLTKSFGGLQAVRGVFLSIEEGERMAILGPNGAGKTTFFNLLSGELPPSGGKIFLYGQDVTRLSSHRRAKRGLARTFQITNLFFNLPVIENMILAVQALEPTKFSLFRPITAFPHLYERGMELLSEAGLEEVKDEVVGTLYTVSSGKSRSFWLSPRNQSFFYWMSLPPVFRRLKP